MSYGRNSPSNCIPHYNEYADDIGLPRRSLLSKCDVQRPRSIHGGVRGGTVAARVRTLNAAYSSSAPSLVLPEDTHKNAKSGLNSPDFQDGSLKSAEPSLPVAQNLHPLRKKASFRTRRQCTLIRTRSNPFVRRDSSAASYSPPLQDERTRARDALIQSPSPLRRLPIGSLNLHDDLPGVSDADLAAAAKSSLRWPNLLWNVWSEVKTNLPRQVLIDAVETKMRDQHEFEHSRDHLRNHGSGSKPDSVADFGVGSLEQYQQRDISIRKIPIDAHLIQSDEYVQQPHLQPYHDHENDSRKEDSSVKKPEGAISQHFSADSRADRAIMSGESEMSIRSTSPWPDFDDVGYIPSENDDSATHFSRNTLLSRHATLSISTSPLDTTTPQPHIGNYSCRPSESKTQSPTSLPENRDINKSTGDSTGTDPGTAIAIRLGDMFDAIIIARGDKPLPQPEITQVGGENQHDRMQDLRQISADLMQRTKELLAAQPMQNGEQHDKAVNAVQDNRGQHSHTRYDGSQLERGLDDYHYYHHHHRRRRHDNYRTPRHSSSRRPFSYEDGSEDESSTEHKANEQVMSVPALLRLVDSTAKDLGLVLKPDESVAPLRIRRARLRHGHGLLVKC